MLDNLIFICIFSTVRILVSVLGRTGMYGLLMGLLDT